MSVAMQVSLVPPVYVIISETKFGLELVAKFWMCMYSLLVVEAYATAWRTKKMMKGVDG